METIAIEPWEIINSREVFVADPWIRVSVQEVKLPNGTVVNDYHQIGLPDFAIIFAQTPSGAVIVERQYKHGAGKVTLTMPAGGIQDGELPLAAAQRELLEETGYQADEWQSMGDFVMHGNYGCGRAFMFKVTNARRVAEPRSGDLEDMEIILMPPREVVAAVRGGQVAMMASVTAIALATRL